MVTSEPPPPPENDDSITHPEEEVIEDPVIDVPSQVESPSSAELKQELYMLASLTDRGFIADGPTRTTLHNTIALLEQSESCTNPLEDERLLGKWELVYTNAFDIISLTLLAPAARITRIFQNVEPNNELVNVIELEPPIGAILNLVDKSRTCTRLEVLAKGTRREDDVRKLDIRFERATVKQTSISFIGGLDLPGLSIPFFGGSPVGYVETTYLDDEMRVARSPSPLGEDGIFVLRRVATST